MDGTSKSKATIDDAEVCLVNKTLADLGELPYSSAKATHTHAGAGKYTSTTVTPAEGDWVLVVRRAGNPRRPALQDEAEEGALRRHRQDHGRRRVARRGHRRALQDEGTSDDLHRAHVPRVQLVFIAGTEYFDAGTQHHMFAEARRRVLLLEKKIDAGTLVTISSRRTTAGARPPSTRPARSGWSCRRRPSAPRRR